jgi:hypothetical protein
MANGSRRLTNPLKCAAGLIIVLNLLAPGWVQAADGDAKALEVAKSVMAGSGEIWSALRFLRFRFVVEKEGKEAVSRVHYWDAAKNRYRLETTDADGKRIVCLMDLPSRIGLCAVGDDVLFNDKAKPHLDRSYAAWINDSYWLLMPYKMMDEGVHLKYEGEVHDEGMTHDKVMLTFEKGTGLTSNDRYWAYVNRESGRMAYWEYVLQDEEGRPGKGAPTRWAWIDWSEYGGIPLASARVSADGITRVLFKELAVFDSLPDEVFSKTRDVRLP